MDLETLVGKINECDMESCLYRYLFGRWAVVLASWAIFTSPPFW